MNNNQNKTFATDNFQLACYLVSEAIPLLSLDKTNPQRVLFNLEESDKRKVLTQKYLANKAETEVHRIFSAQKDLKQLIYQNK